jgi:hypothetical protein
VTTTIFSPTATIFSAKSQEPELMSPWYKGFQGTINLLDGKPKNYYVSGIISEISGQFVLFTVETPRLKA